MSWVPGNVSQLANRIERESGELYCFIDESGTHDESEVTVMALVTISFPDEVRKKCTEVLQEIQRHPEMSLYLPSVRMHGIEHFHYTSDHIEVREMYLDAIKEIDANAYLIFVRRCDMGDPPKKLDLLLEFFKTLLLPRIQENSHRDIRIVYERLDEGDKEVEQRFRSEAESLHRQVTATRCAAKGSISIAFDTKQELCLGVSDYACGVFSGYMKKIISGTPDSLEERHFHRISGKFRLIHDYGRKRWYSRNGVIFNMGSYLSSCGKLTAENP